MSLWKKKSIDEQATVVKDTKASSSTHKKEGNINKHYSSNGNLNDLKIKEEAYRKQRWYTSEGGCSNKCKDKTSTRQNKFPVSLSIKTSRNLVVWMQLTCLKGRILLLDGERELMEQAQRSEVVFKKTDNSDQMHNWSMWRWCSAHEHLHCGLNHADYQRGSICSWDFSRAGSDQGFLPKQKSGLNSHTFSRFKAL